MNERRERRLAVALGYRPAEDGSPRVLASGGGLWADRITAAAAEHDVPVRSDHDLAQLLSGLPLESEIPPELYPAVAQVFAFLYSLSSEPSPESSSDSPS